MVGGNFPNSLLTPGLRRSQTNENDNERILILTSLPAAPDHILCFFDVVSSKKRREGGYE